MNFDAIFQALPAATQIGFLVGVFAAGCTVSLAIHWRRLTGRE